MTVQHLSDTMTRAELRDWMALDAIRKEESDRAERQAGKGMRPR